MAGKQSMSDYRCSICFDLLIEPVELPCKHEFCRPCFRHNVEEANFVCPICRRRIASWARKCNREGTLVNQKKWNHIQKLFPEKCLKRLKGEDDDSEDECLVPPKRVLAESGELRQEYEKEMNKVLEEKEKEQKASEELIKTLLEKEQAAQLQRENQQKNDELLAKRIANELKNQKQVLEEKEKEQKASEELIKTLLEKEQAAQLQRENQQKNDELLAKRIANELKNQKQSCGEGSSVPKNSLSSTLSKGKLKSTIKKRRLSNGKTPQTSHTIDKYFALRSREKDCTPMNDNTSDNEEKNTDKDLELAKQLQKQYDEEAATVGKREDYMLRKTIENEPNDNNKEVCMSST